MSATYTYDSLRAAIQAMLDDDSTELEASLDEIIALGELRLLRDLDLEIFDKLVPLTFTPGNSVLAKPEGTVATRDVLFIKDNELTRLEPRGLDFCWDYWPNTGATTAVPRYYADLDEDNWHIAGTPSSAYSVRARVMIRPEGLSSTNTTTWLSTRTADLLFTACLLEGEAFIKADERVPLWKANYGERLAAARSEFKDSIRRDYWLFGKKV